MCRNIRIKFISCNFLGKRLIQTNPSKFDKRLFSDVYLCRLHLKHGKENLHDFILRESVLEFLAQTFLHLFCYCWQNSPSNKRYTSVCTVCIWRCEHARFCVEFFLCAIYKFSFIYSFILLLKKNFRNKMKSFSGSCFSASLRKKERKKEKKEKIFLRLLFFSKAFAQKKV